MACLRLYESQALSPKAPLIVRQPLRLSQGLLLLLCQLLWLLLRSITPRRWLNAMDPPRAQLQPMEAERPHSARVPQLSPPRRQLSEHGHLQLLRLVH